MASITSLSNSNYNTSSIYGNRNILSGLASGMDTESMIENAVSGIKMKIQNLTKKRTKLEWQQEAYRSIIDKAANFNTKYTSYTSKTNLLSSSFFANAVNTAVLGTYADKISASGKSSSDIRINSVSRMATAATYTVSGLAGMTSGEIQGITGKDFDISGTIPVSTVSGSLSFQYGGTNGTTFDISFDELENLKEDVKVYNEDGTVKEDASDTEKLAQAIRNKLSEITYTYTKNGFQESTTADKAIKVGIEMGRIYFEDGLGNGNTVKINSSSGEIKKYAGSSVLVSPGALVKDTPREKYLADKELGISFNGTTKRIKMSDVLEGAKTAAGSSDNEKFANALNDQLDEAFGKGKIKASYEGGKLSITPNPNGKGDVMTLGGSAIKALGFENGDSNYINTGKKLTDILGGEAEAIFDKYRLKGVYFDENGKPTDKMTPIEKKTPNGTVYYVDGAGNSVDKEGYRLDGNGKALYAFTVNDVQINVTEDTTLESLMNSINSNAEAGVKVSYSKLTNEFKFTATETGANSQIRFGGMAEKLFGDTEFTPVEGSSKISDILGGFSYGGGNNFSMTIDGKEFTMQVDENDTMDDIMEKMSVLLTWENGGDPNGPLSYKASVDPETNQLVITGQDGKKLDYSLGSGLASDLFNKIGNKFTAGQDAVMDVTINGVRFKDLTRSSNTFDLDGLTVSVKGTFGEVGKDGADYEPVTFNTTTDTDKIVEAIRSFVDDYNEMATEIKKAYSTQPAYKNKTTRYEPLTAEQEEQYSESELKAYNEKAKQGILFGDTTLSSMYSKLLSAIAPGGSDGQTLREIGIGTAYSDGMTTLSLDEDKLRSTLENDPDKVKNAFAKTKEGGSSSDGLMQTLQNTLNTYVKTTGEPKGVLITKAGSIKAPTSLNSNSLKSQIDNIDNQIDRWQDKMSDQIDRYTTQFSRLEQLIAEMNSQASAFAGLMGGSSGY